MDTVELGIVDTRNIIKILNEVYGYDFSNYALTSLRRGFEKVIARANLRDVDTLIHRLRNDETFFPEFLSYFLVKSTEMFRDPSLWRVLKNDFLPLQLKKHSSYKIWHPNVIAGHELYSLMIILREAGLADKTQVFTSGICSPCIDELKEGTFGRKVFEVSAENYIRYQGTSDFAQYAWTEGETARRDHQLLEKVQFIEQGKMFEEAPKNVNLIIFRNNLIYYNQTLQDRVLEIMHDSLSVNGHIILGVMESITGAVAKKFTLIHESESIYKKKQ